MRYILDVKSFAPPPGKEYDAASYPGPGLYQNTSTMNWYLVYQMNTTLCVIGIGSGYSPPLPLEKYEETKPVENARPEAGITAADLLRAIAISQNPLLAKELLK